MARQKGEKQDECLIFTNHLNLQEKLLTVSVTENQINESIQSETDQPTLLRIDLPEPLAMAASWHGH